MPRIRIAWAVPGFQDWPWRAILATRRLVAAGHVVGVMLGYRPAPSLSPIEEVRPPDFGTDPGNGDSSALRFTFPDSDQRAGSLQPRPREVRDVAGQ